MESMNFFDGGSDATSKVFDSLVGADLLEGNLRKEVYRVFRKWYIHLPDEQKQSEIESLNNTSRFLLQLSGEEFSYSSNDTPEEYMQYVDDVGKCIWGWVKNFKYPEYVYLINRSIPIKRKSTELPNIKTTSLMYDVYTRSIRLIAIMKDGTEKEFLPIHKVSAVVLYRETVYWDVLKAFVTAYYSYMLRGNVAADEDYGYFVRNLYYGNLDKHAIVGFRVDFPEEDVTKEYVDLDYIFTEGDIDRADHTLYANLTVDMRDVCCSVCDRISYMMWCIRNDIVYNEYDGVETDSVVEDEEMLLLRRSKGKDLDIGYRSLTCE